MASNYCGYKTK